jgi:hypothetical protein
MEGASTWIVRARWRSLIFTAGTIGVLGVGPAVRAAENPIAIGLSITQTGP